MPRARSYCRRVFFDYREALVFQQFFNPDSTATITVEGGVINGIERTQR